MRQFCAKIMEGDALVSVKGLNSAERNLSRSDHLLEDTRRVLQSIQNWRCQHVTRLANMGAHTLANLAIKTFIDKIWVVDAPIVCVILS